MFNINYLRSFKIYGYAIFDLLVSFLGIYLLAPLLTKFFTVFHISIPRSSWLYFTLPIGIIFHILVGNYTPMTRYFLDPSSHYLLKFVIIILFLLGVRGIKFKK